MSVTEVENRGIFQRLASHSGLKKYFFNTSWLMAENILRLVMGLVVGFWVARYLGPEQLGLFSYTVAFVSLFSCFAHLGLDVILVREIVKEPNSLNVLMGTAFWLKLFGAFITIMLIVAVLNFFAHEDRVKQYIYIVASGMIFQSFVVIDIFFQSQVLSKFVSICKLIQLAISSAFKIVLVLCNAELFWFIALSLLDSITLAISLFIAFYYHRGFAFYKYFDKNIARRLLADAWPLIFSSLAVMLYMRIDQIMIKHMLSDNELGVYSAAVRLSEVWYFIPVLICSSLFPAILNARKTSESHFLNRISLLYSFMGCLAIAIAIFVTFTGKWLVVFLYGEKFVPAGQVLIIHIWAGLFVFWGVASGKWYLTENLTGLSTINTIIGCVCNILLNLWLIPVMGSSGAAIATVFSYCVSAFLMNLVHIKTRCNFVRLISSINPFKMWSNYEKVFKANPAR